MDIGQGYFCETQDIRNYTGPGPGPRGGPLEVELPQRRIFYYCSSPKWQLFQWTHVTHPAARDYSTSFLLSSVLSDVG
jgi:hypothetical protein